MPPLTRITTLLSGHALTALAALVRNLVLARLLGPQDYGLAITLVVLVAAAEMTTTLGLPQLIVSHAKGGTRAFQATLHGLQIMRGILGAVMILLVAQPLAMALDAPGAADTLRTAALVPLILSATHLDMARAQRHRKHRPQVLVLAVPAVLSLLVLLAIVNWKTGPEVMIYLLVFQATATMIISHLVARRAYRFQIEGLYTSIAFKYGLPLAANGVLLFMVLHAEKLISGSVLGLSDMGLLAMGGTLTMTPALILARSFQAYHLPRLRKGGVASQVLAQGVILGVALAVTLSLIAPLVLPIVGVRFEAILPLLPALSCLAALRVPKSALATLALAEGRTYLPILANIPRLLAAPIVWVALSRGGSIETLITIAISAEFLGLCLGAWARREKFSPMRPFA